MFAIVECEEGDEFTVSVIPISWFKDGLCYWPNYTSAKLKSAVRKQELPSYDTWKKYNGRLLKTFGNSIQL